LFGRREQQLLLFAKIDRDRVLQRNKEFVGRFGSARSCKRRLVRTLTCGTSDDDCPSKQLVGSLAWKDSQHKTVRINSSQ
jgi:hypothetical protein